MVVTIPKSILMSLHFNERKATEVAAFLLRLRGGRMHYLKLIKLLYLADREALLRWGVPVTTDRYVSMDNGPVTSKIYNLLVDEGDKPFWSQYISAPSEYQVSLLQDAPGDLLSRAEEVLLRDIFARYGHMNRWDLVGFVHTLPEWKDPNGSAIPISIRDIIRAGGLHQEDVEAIVTELDAEGAAQESLRETA
jgi:uncharacterized phage-associated protein